MSKRNLESHFDLKRDNQDCLTLTKLIDRKANLFKKYKDPFNIYKVFYHELVTYCTNYILIKNSSYKYKDSINFPFINSKYISNPKKIIFRKLPKSNSIYDNYSFGLGKEKIYISNNFHLKKNILINIFSNKKIRFISSCYIDFPEFDIQIKKLEIVMREIELFLKVANHNFGNNFKNYVLNILSNNNKRKFNPKNCSLIVGTNMNLENRILSAKFMQDKSNKVISVNHSNYPFYIYKEPIRSVEYSICTDYVSYGKFRFSKKLSNRIFTLPNFHHVSNLDLKKIKISKKIKVLDIEKKQEYLYVPNMLNGNIRYGPFRDMEDSIYYKFQYELLNYFKNTKIKVHPNGKNLYFNKDRKSNSKNFEQILNKYDVFIFDYFSTPFSRAIATDKPIIYFDIGLRRLEKHVLDTIKKRVYYYKINLNQSFEKQFQDFLVRFSSYKKKKVNYFTEKFSLNSKNDDINKLIKKLV